jgi:clan AA aspartic protease
METKNMGIVYVEITLKNAGDVSNVERGLIKEPEVRETTVRAMVDTGAGTLVINEAVRNELGLIIRGYRSATLANGERSICKVAEGVRVYWKERSMLCEPVVLPNAKEVLLGAVPLEDMDLIVNPAKLELTGAHGDEIMTYIL